MRMSSQLFPTWNSSANGRVEHRCNFQFRMCYSAILQGFFSRAGTSWHLLSYDFFYEISWFTGEVDHRVGARLRLLSPVGLVTTRTVGHSIQGAWCLEYFLNGWADGGHTQAVAVSDVTSLTVREAILHNRTPKWITVTSVLIVANRSGPNPAAKFSFQSYHRLLSSFSLLVTIW